mmetsp:Transcript_60975/g.157231  ORF Transcript_60975/g.157231 Transcript_60975/m.157231 type:complete len:297 (+) Transcript_60975:748-1638(+)
MVGVHIILLPGEVLKLIRGHGVLRVVALCVMHELLMRSFDGVQVIGVLVGVIAEHLLDAGQAFLFVGVLLGKGSELIGYSALLLLQGIKGRSVGLTHRAFLRHSALEVVELLLRIGELVSMLVFMVSQRALHEAQPLVRGLVVQLVCLHVARHLRVVRLLGFEGLRMGVVLRSCSAHLPLQVVQTFLHSQVVHVALLLVLGDEVVDLAVVRLRVRLQLRVRLLERLQLLGVLIEGVAEQPLHVLDALLDRLTVSIERLRVAGQASVGLLKVAMCTSNPLAGRHARVQGRQALVLLV